MCTGDIFKVNITVLSTDSRSASVNMEDFYNQSQQSLNRSAGDLNMLPHPSEGYQARRASSASTYMSQYHQQQQQQQLQQQYQQHVRQQL